MWAANAGLAFVGAWFKRSFLRPTLSGGEGNRIVGGVTLAFAMLILATTLLGFGNRDTIFIISLSFYLKSFFALKYSENVNC